MKRSPLHDLHQNLGAQMGEFAGFSMPLQYAGTKEEVFAVRQNVGIFDVGHMGEFRIQGKQAAAFMDFLIPNDFLNAPLQTAVYSPLLNHEGGILDDLIAYKLAEGDVLICVNAANRQKDWEWITAHAGEFACQLRDESDDWALLAIQGPAALELIASLHLEELENLENLEGQANISELPRFGLLANLRDPPGVVLARTGYTGEEGVEIFCSPAKAQELWQLAQQKGATPCGLVARDVLRIEAGLPLYGQELTEKLLPQECGLAWTVKKNKPSFLGREAIITSQAPRRLIKLVTNQGVPRHGQPVLNQSGKNIGTVSSGTFSPGSRQGLAMAHVKRAEFSKGDSFFIKIREKQKEAYLTPSFLSNLRKGSAYGASSE